MAGLRFTVLLTASSFGVLLLFLLVASASASASRPPTVYFVGDEWRAAPASNGGTHKTTLSKWAMRHRFYVGDVLDFKRSNDSVLLVRRRDYKRCSAASPPARRFADGGDTRLKLAHPGLFYFISGAPARCEAGQRMVLRVVDARSSLGGGAAPAEAPAPAPAPGPGTMEPTNVTNPPSDRPIPVWFKLLAPALLGFLAGCSFAGVIMWLCMNCAAAVLDKLGL